MYFSDILLGKVISLVKTGCNLSRNLKVVCTVVFVSGTWVICHETGCPRSSTPFKPGIQNGTDVNSVSSFKESKTKLLSEA